MHDSKLFWEETTEPSTEGKCSSYDYYVDGRTGTVHLWGEHMETDILLKIAEDLDIGYTSSTQLNSKIWENRDNIKSIEIHYKKWSDWKYAIVKYCWCKNTPRKIVAYQETGIDLLTNKILKTFQWLPSLNFIVIQEGFNSHEEAEKALEKMKKKVSKHGK